MRLAARPPTLHTLTLMGLEGPHLHWGRAGRGSRAEGLSQGQGGGGTASTHGALSLHQAVGVGLGRAAAGLSLGSAAAAWRIPQTVRSRGRERQRRRTEQGDSGSSCGRRVWVRTRVGMPEGPACAKAPGQRAHRGAEGQRCVWSPVSVVRVAGMVGTGLHGPWGPLGFRPQ